MVIAFQCPGCGHRFEKDQALAGKRARCKYCKQEFRIPGPSTENLSSPPTGVKAVEPPRTPPLAPAPTSATPPFVARQTTLEPEPEPYQFVIEPSPTGDLFDVVSDPAPAESSLPLPGRVSMTPASPERPGPAVRSRYASSKEREPTPRKAAAFYHKKLRTLIACLMGLLLTGPAVWSAYRAIRRAMTVQENQEERPNVADMPVRKDVLAQHEPLLEEVMNTWNGMADAYAAVNNPDTLQAAEAKIGAMGKRMVELQKKGAKLPKLNAAENGQLLRTYGARTKEALGRVKQEVLRIRSIPELSNRDFSPILGAVDRAVFTMDTEMQEYERRLRDDQYVEVIVRGVDSPEAGQILTQKFRKMMDRSFNGVSTGIHLDGNAKTMTCRVSPVPDVNAFATHIDFGKVDSTSGRKVYVSAFPPSSAELAGLQRENSPAGQLDKALDQLPSSNEQARGEAIRTVEDLQRKSPTILQTKRAVLVSGLQTLLSGDNRNQRGDAARVLIALGWPETVTAFLNALQSSRSDSQIEAIHALETLAREKRSLLDERRDDVLKAIDNLAKAQNRSIWGPAVNLLKGLEWPEAVPILLHGLDVEDSTMRGDSLRALLEIGRDRSRLLNDQREEVAATFARLMREDDEFVRGESTRFMIDRGWPETVPALLHVMQGSDPRRRADALRGLLDLTRQKRDLVQSHRDEVVTALDERVRAEDRELWNGVFDLIRTLEWPELVPVLLHTVQVPTPDLRAAGFRVLQEFCQQKPTLMEPYRADVAKTLEGLLDTDDRFFRADVAKTLVTIAGPDNVPALVHFLQVEDAFGRNEVMDFLVTLKDPRAAEVIAAGLTKDRDRAAQALMGLGSPAEPAVLPYLNHQDPGVRQKACEVLSQIGTKASRAALQKAALDQNEGVSRAAQGALSAIANRRG